MDFQLKPGETPTQYHTRTEAPTVAEAYNFQQPSYGNTAAINSATSQLGDISVNGLDTGTANSIRQQTLGNFQQEINAQNDIYASKLAAAKTQGQNQLGSNTALLASTGAIGSNVGQASQFGVQQHTNDTLAAIEAEKANAIGSLLRGASEAATKAIAEKTQAKQSGLTAYVSHLNSQADRAAKNAEAAGQSILNSGYDLSTIKPEDLQAMATGYGISVGDIKAAYNAAKVKHDAELAKAAQDSQFTLGEGQQRFGADGTVIATGLPKTTSADSQKLVTINGESYIQNPDGSYTKPQLPQTPYQRSQEATDTVNIIDKLLSSKTEDITGTRRFTNFVPGTEKYRMNKEFEQLRNILSLENRAKLKGQGAVSDFEGKMLAAASLAVDTAYSNKDFRSGLAALKTKILLGTQGSPGDVVTSIIQEGGDRGTTVKKLQAEGYAPEKIINYLYPEYQSPEELSQVSFNPVGNTSASIPAGTLAAKNNNPGNLRFAGQAGAQPGKGGFAMFSSPQAGAAALLRQVQLDASRGHNLSSFIAKFAPPTENDTALYVRQVAAMIGADPNTPLSQLDLAAVTRAIAKKESGTTLS